MTMKIVCVPLYKLALNHRTRKAKVEHGFVLQESGCRALTINPLPAEPRPCKTT